MRQQSSMDESVRGPASFEPDGIATSAAKATAMLWNDSLRKPHLSRVSIVRHVRHADRVAKASNLDLVSGSRSGCSIPFWCVCASGLSPAAAVYAGGGICRVVLHGVRSTLGYGLPSDTRAVVGLEVSYSPETGIDICQMSYAAFRKIVHVSIR